MSASPTRTQVQALVPLPRSVEPLEGSCDLPRRSRWSGDRATLDLLEKWLPKSTGANESSLVFRLKPRERRIAGEGYELTIRDGLFEAVAPTRGGLVFAAQTLRQLAFGRKGNIPCLRVSDNPRFPWRGVLLDSARHFFPVDTVLRLLDLASLHKLNRFHWHLTDDQGWRLEIRSWPRLTTVGSVRRMTQVRGLPLGERRRSSGLFDDKPYGGFYTQRDVQRVVSHAHALEITVVPEIDLPGHMQAAIAAYPELGNGNAAQVSTAWGVSHHVLNVEPETVRFLEDVLEEVLELFPGPWVHLGGDEVPIDEWKASPAARARSKQLGLGGVGGLQGWFVQYFAKWLADRGRTIVGWDEILERSGGKLPMGTLLMSWRGERAGMAAARGGNAVVMTPTTHTYFDYPQTARRVSLRKVYHYNPVPEGLEQTAAARILGSQGQLWTEWIPDQDALDRQAFPRLCALSEVLWSPATERSWGGFQARLAGHLQLLDSLGVRYHR